MQSGQCAGYLERLNKAVATAQHINREVDGVVGQQISQISSALEVLAHTIFEDWPNVWIERPAFGKSISAQQVDALNSCRELNKAFKHLIEIFQFRHFEHKRELEKNKPLPRWTQPDEVPTVPFQVMRPDPIPVVIPALPRPGPSQPRPIVTQLIPSPSGPSAVAKEEDANPSSSTKGKEIKEEPVDSDGQNQGSPSQPSRVKKPKEEDKKDEQKKDIKEEPLDEGFPEVKSEPIADVYCPTTGMARPLNGTARNGHEAANGMPSQPGPSYVSQTTPPRPPYVRKTDTIIWENGKIAGFLPASDNTRPFFRNQLVDYTPPIRDQASERFSKYAGIVEPRTCYLCEKPTVQYEGTPTNEYNREQFLDRIILLTANHRARVAALRKNYNRAFFCKLHIAVREIPKSIETAPEETEEERRLKGALSVPVKFKPTFNRELIREVGIQPPPRKASHLNRKCDLCGDPAIPFLFSPKDPKVAKKFFSNLINITEQGRETIDWFVKHEKRVTVCRKHVKKDEQQPKRVVQVPKYLTDLARKHREERAKEKEKGSAGQETELVVVPGSNKRKQTFLKKPVPRDPSRLRQFTEGIKDKETSQPGPSGVR